MSMIDKSLQGKRIELIHTDDPYTKLRIGDRGTIKHTFLNLGEEVIHVDWDTGSNLSLIVGRDQYKILDNEARDKVKAKYGNNQGRRF